MTLELAARLTAGLFLALAFGGMTFFSGVVAPLVFARLPAATAGGFIRALFPWYYLTVGAASALAAVALALAGEWAAAALAGIAAAGFAAARQGLMPRINRSRDGGNTATFNRLHRLSVVLNLVQWVLLGAALITVLS